MGRRELGMGALMGLGLGRLGPSGIEYAQLRLPTKQ